MTTETTETAPVEFRANAKLQKAIYDASRGHPEGLTIRGFVDIITPGAKYDSGLRVAVDKLVSVDLLFRDDHGTPGRGRRAYVYYPNREAMEDAKEATA